MWSGAVDKCTVPEGPHRCAQGQKGPAGGTQAHFREPPSHPVLGARRPLDFRLSEDALVRYPLGRTPEGGGKRLKRRDSGVPGTRGVFYPIGVLGPSSWGPCPRSPPAWSLGGPTPTVAQAEGPGPARGPSARFDWRQPLSRVAGRRQRAHGPDAPGGSRPGNSRAGQRAVGRGAEPLPHAPLEPPLTASRAGEGPGARHPWPSGQIATAVWQTDGGWRQSLALG